MHLGALKGLSGAKRVLQRSRSLRGSAVWVSRQGGTEMPGRESARYRAGSPRSGCTERDPCGFQGSRTDQ